MEDLNFFSSGFLNYSFFGNSVSEYLTAFLAFIFLFSVFAVFNKFILVWLSKISRKTKTDLDDTFIQIVSNLKPPFYAFLAFYFALRFIEIQGFIQGILTAVLVIWIVYQIAIASNILVDYAVKKYSKKEKTDGTKGAINLIGKIAKGVLWTIAGLFILSNLGVNITSLVAGLGIGGIAVALALQNILSDLFSSFSIYFDKPFVPGDFIVVGDDMGVVEHIGIKTTRLRALQGEELVISNKELTSARIHNFKNLKERRVTFSFGVTYDTSNEKLRKITEIIKNIIEPTELARFDRVHFHNFGDSSLDFEVVYYTQTSDFNKYKDIHQEIILKIKEELEKEKISMAFPTRTIYLESPQTI